MADEQVSETLPHPAELAHFVTAAIAAMAVTPLVGAALSLGSEPGTEPWQNGLLGLAVVAGLYLLTVAFGHLGHAWRGASAPPPRWSLVARIAVDVAVALVAAVCLARGPASRLLLAGLSDALPGLIAAAAISAGITLYGWRRLPPHASVEAEDASLAKQPSRGIFHLLIGLALIAGLIAAELQPLPRTTPAADQPAETATP